MERHVQERLVGAAVLMAAAIILIPEMLSGPDRASRDQDTHAASDGTMKTYTIDLDGSSGSTSVPSVTEEPAPPPEVVAEAIGNQPMSAETPPRADQANPESGVAGSSTTTTENTPTPAPKPATSASQPAPSAATAPERTEERARATQEPKPALASVPAVPTSRGWAVQLGSFSNQASAQRLARDFRADRYEAFVMPVKTASGTLYRVRIGPLDDRAAADEILRNVKQKVAGAAVVSHP